MYNEELGEATLHQPLAPAAVTKPRIALVVPETQRLVVTILSFMSFFGLGSLVGVTGPSIPELAQELGCHETKLGSLFTCRGSGYLTGSLLVSFAETYLRKDHLLLLCLLLAGISTFAAAFSHSLGLLSVFLFIQGLGLGGVDVSGNAVLIEMWGKKVDPFMQTLHACFGLGSVASPAAVGALNYRIAFIAFAALCMLPSVAYGIFGSLSMTIGLIRRRPPPLSSALGDANAMNEPPQPSAAAADDGDGEGESIAAVELLPSIPFSIRLWITFFFFIYVGLEVGYGGWIATVLLLENLTDSKTKAAYGVSVFWAAITIGRLCAIPIAIILRPTNFLICQMLLLSIGTTLIMTTFTQSFMSATICSGLFGLGVSSIFPIMMTLPGDMGLLLDMRSTSTFLIGSCLGESLIPVLIGFSMDRFDVDIFSIAVLVCSLLLWLSLMLIGLTHLWLRNREEEGRNKTQTQGLHDDQQQSQQEVI